MQPVQCPWAHLCHVGARMGLAEPQLVRAGARPTGATVRRGGMWRRVESGGLTEHVCVRPMRRCKIASVDVFSKPYLGRKYIYTSFCQPPLCFSFVTSRSYPPLSCPGASAFSH